MHNHFPIQYPCTVAIECIAGRCCLFVSPMRIKIETKDFVMRLLLRTCPSCAIGLKSCVPRHTRTFDSTLAQRLFWSMPMRVLVWHLHDRKLSTMFLYCSSLLCDDYFTSLPGKASFHVEFGSLSQPIHTTVSSHQWYRALSLTGWRVRCSWWCSRIPVHIGSAPRRSCR